MSANYNGRQPNNTSYIKTFVSGLPVTLWKSFDLFTSTIVVRNITKTIKGFLTSTNLFYTNLLIQGNSFINGSSFTSNDINNNYLNHDIQPLSQTSDYNNLLQVDTYSYIDEDGIPHYGYNSDNLSTLFPSLTTAGFNGETQTVKHYINTVELTPMLIYGIQRVQTKVTCLQNEIATINTNLAIINAQIADIYSKLG